MNVLNYVVQFPIYISCFALTWMSKIRDITLLSEKSCIAGNIWLICNLIWWSKYTYIMRYFHSYIKDDEWSPCSVTCGEGWRKREVHCKIFLEFSRTIAKLPDSKCMGPKPTEETERCVMEPCSMAYGTSFGDSSAPSYSSGDRYVITDISEFMKIMKQWIEMQRIYNNVSN